MKERKILLSFDVEEFDIPLEYQYNITPEEQMRVGAAGLDAIMPILEAYEASSTMFITGNFATHFPDKIKRLAQLHEIASHTYFHSQFENTDLLKSKNVLEQISGKSVTGLRMPRMREVEMNEVKKVGYQYDSSINPTWLPGRYNKLHLPRTPYLQDGMLRFPASVSPGLRLPLFWLGFKNYPYSLFLHLCKQTLNKDGYVCLYFHPWEFTAIEGYNLPGFVKKYNGQKLQERLIRLIKDLKKEGEFDTMQNYISGNALLRKPA